MSERHACRLLGQWRGTQRYEPMDRSDEDELTRAVIETGEAVRTLWLSANHSAAAEWRLASRQRAGTANLAAGRAKSAAKTKAKKTVMVERRFLRAAQAGATQPGVELRLCEREDS